MRFLLLRMFPAALLVAGATSLLRAAEPVFWLVSTEGDLLAGEVESLSIDAQGRLTLGPVDDSVYESSAPFLWDLMTGADGGVLVGSGNDGEVFRVEPDGTATVLFDAEEIEAHAVAAGADGSVYVGTSPDGRIYRVDTTGTASEFYDPESYYIWALTVDGDGTVYAAGGDPGDVYRIAPDGTGEVFYSTQATHAMTLARAADGALLVGTAAPGRVFRLDADGRPFVLLDSPYNEVHSLRVGENGNVYAAALGMGTQVGDAPAIGGGNSQPSASVSTSGTATVTVTTSVTGTAPINAITTGPQPSGAGAVYRILPNGVWDQLWQSRTDTPYDVLPQPDGSLLVATGNDGKVFRLAGDPVVPSLVAESTAQQVTALTHGANGMVLFATANPGQVRRLSTGRADTGTYTSVVRDAGTVATWGTIAWQAAPGGGRVEVATRSGNTDTPDETWSDWSTPYDDPVGSPITSPNARFIQWRATLIGGDGPAPVLDSVTTAYLPRNRRPRVASITLHPPGTVFQQIFPAVPGIAGFDGERPQPESATGGNGGSPTLGRQEYQPGLLTFVWQGADEDGDKLSYDIQYRRETETDWVALRSDVTDTILVWDTTSVANGRYSLRIVVSDALSNSPATRLTGYLDSEAFDIDNTAPAIEVTAVTRDGNGIVVAFMVRDGHSAIAEAGYSLDGTRWQAVYPADGIADSRVEGFELALPSGTIAQGVVLRATDALRNTATVSTALPQ